MPSELWVYLQGRDPGELARDALDIAITYYVFYRIALVLRGTRALQVGVGLALVFLLYVVAQLLHLHTVLTLLQAVLSSAILIGVVVFQNDIRRGLMRMGARASFGASQNTEAEVIDNVVEAATQLARHRIGAIITFEQEANLDEFVGSHTGFSIDAAVSTDLLVSMFIPEGINKLHDGAVIIRDFRIAKAGVFFPMPEGRVMDQSFGSRHRAAMGITEETDAIVIVVSEERGSISFCFNGNIITNLDGDRLRAALDGVFAPKRARKRRWFAFFRKPAQETDAPSASTDRGSQPKSEVAPKAEPKPAPSPAETSPVPLRKITDEADSKDKPSSHERPSTAPASNAPASNAPASNAPASSAQPSSAQSSSAQSSSAQSSSAQASSTKRRDEVASDPPPDASKPRSTAMPSKPLESKPLESKPRASKSRASKPPDSNTGDESAPTPLRHLTADSKDRLVDSSPPRSNKLPAGQHNKPKTIPPIARTPAKPSTESSDEPPGPRRMMPRSESEPEKTASGGDTP